MDLGDETWISGPDICAPSARESCTALLPSASEIGKGLMGEGGLRASDRDSDKGSDGASLPAGGQRRDDWEWGWHW